MAVRRLSRIVSVVILWTTVGANAQTLDEVSRARLIERVRCSFALDWEGTHGIGHWERLRTYGLYLGRNTPGANAKVVEIFAYLHDSRREKNWEDPDHGRRAVRVARDLDHEYLGLSSEELDILEKALAGHNGGLCESALNPTVAVCWDADRLDLMRPGVNSSLDLRQLCTSTARRPEVIDWAYRVSHGTARSEEGPMHD